MTGHDADDRGAVALADVVGRFAPVSLDEMESVALLHTRFDRKYVLAPEVATALLADLGARTGVLEIDGTRTFTYRSRYFDTESLDSYRGAAFARRTRFKVRTRTYEDHGTCALEVKTRGPRGTTVKVRLPHDPGAWNELTDDGGEFVDAHVGRPGLHRLLDPVLTTSYRRTTVVDPADGSRATVDRHLVCTHRSGPAIALQDRFVVETKSTGAATTLDRLLWARGIRPERISKFGVGMALHDPSLPANRWNQVLRRHFAWQPDHDRRWAARLAAPPVRQTRPVSAPARRRVALARLLPAS